MLLTKLSFLFRFHHTAQISRPVTQSWEFADERGVAVIFLCLQSTTATLFSPVFVVEIRGFFAQLMTIEEVNTNGSSTGRDTLQCETSMVNAGDGVTEQNHGAI